MKYGGRGRGSDVEKGMEGRNMDEVWKERFGKKEG
jgi:hypothetical protein